MRCNVVLLNAGIAGGETQWWEKSLLRTNRIHVPLCGGAVYCEPNGEKLLECGYVYILPNSLARNLKLDSNGRYDHLYLDFQTFPPLLGRDVIKISHEDDGVMKSLIEAVRSFILEYDIQNTAKIMPNDPDVAEQIGKILDAAVLHLHKKYGLSTVENKKIEKLISYIEEHYAEPIGSAEFANILHVDSRHLSRLFSKYMNMSPYQYLTQCRIEHSLIELRQGRSVAETAYLCGYQSENAFRIAFKKIMGCPPGNFVKQF